MTTNTDTTTATALPLAPGHWTLDTTHSTISFWIRHLGVSKVRGRFDRFEASLEVGPTADEVQVAATVDVASVDTGNPDRDAHLRTKDFLDVEQFPQMTFTSTGVSGPGVQATQAGPGVRATQAGTGGDWTMEGQLTIAGVTRPIVLAVEFGGVQDFYDGTHAGFAAEGRVDRRDFGLEWTLPPGAPSFAVGDQINVQLDLQFLAPAGEAS